jgi:hypothetical protein
VVAEPLAASPFPAREEPVPTPAPAVGLVEVDLAGGVRLRLIDQAGRLRQAAHLGGDITLSLATLKASPWTKAMATHAGTTRSCVFLA